MLFRKEYTHEAYIPEKKRNDIDTRHTLFYVSCIEHLNAIELRVKSTLCVPLCYRSEGVVSMPYNSSFFRTTQKKPGPNHKKRR